MNVQGSNVIALAVTVIFLAVLSGCATSPTVHTDVDNSADFSEDRTYAFASELGTDREGYSTLVTDHFKRAVSNELDARGYRYDASNPDLIVNFNARIRTQSDVVSTPEPALGAGYYGYRYGLYTAWPLYAEDIDTVTYKVGTANVDVVDAERRQLVWEGVAEGELTEKAMNDMTGAINNVVAKLFEKYPATAGRPANGADRG